MKGASPDEETFLLKKRNEKKNQPAKRLRKLRWKDKLGKQKTGRSSSDNEEMISVRVHHRHLNPMLRLGKGDVKKKPVECIHNAANRRGNPLANPIIVKNRDVLSQEISILSATV